MNTATESGFFSSDLIPSLGARINRATKLRKHIISPFDPRYRAWEMFLILLVIYSAWISPFEFAFLPYKQDALFIIDNIVNCFFAVDIVLTFFVAYLDSQSYLLIDNPRKIAIRYLSTWFLFDVCSTVPFQALCILFTDHNGELGFKLLSMLRLWRLRRVSALFARLEKDIRFNYFWTRCTKLVSVTLFAVHCAGCFNYMIADRYPDPERTWMRDTVRSASEFVKRNQLPPRIQDQLLSHICLKFKTEGLKQQETLNGLPKAIRCTIAHYLFYPVVQNVNLFHGVSPDFLFQLVPELEAEYYPPREDVILQNEAPTDAYILVSGAVDFVAKINGRDQIVGKASSGEIFGEIGVLCGGPQPFGVRTTEISQILRLNKTTFLNILHGSPEDERCVMNNLFLETAVPLLEIKEGNHKKQETSAHTTDSRFMTTKQSRNDDTKESEIDENSSAEDGQTALHVAVQQGHLEMVRLLLERGANVNKPDKRGWTPKALAEKHPNKGIYDLILNYDNEKKLDGPTNYATNHYREHNYVSACSSAYPTGVEHIKSAKKRVTIHMKSHQNKHSGKQLAKLIILPDSLEELLKIAGQKFGEDSLTSVVNADNAEIHDLSVIRDGDHLFLLSSQCEGGV
ncbi:UNVERIFIED_CONTAM: Potassium channel KAT2 [Sesamum radiatum]|uniref:Potassium channel n=1 Tax=Sesamum radiatum TaxID=300843 RepID=A0AAW2T163_SESRA